MPNIGEMIHPEDLIRAHGVEYFCQKAEDYFVRFPLPETQLGKPFSDPKEAPRDIHHLGLLFAGLKLGKAQRVLDFRFAILDLRFVVPLSDLSASVAR